MDMYLLLKGSPNNVSWSLTDMKYKRSELLKGKPDKWMLWGIRERFKWILNDLPGSLVFLYVTKGEEISGGLALYGVAHEVIELKKKYWPQGVWRRGFYLELKGAVKGIIENPENPTEWRLILREKLRKLGIAILPGPQKISEDKANILKELFK
ncbi:MAG: hypothetical protein DRJ41_02860 [Thermoprotei archaeon]|nr:MAG: hypothetical protein DRJ41_02860 [Thermoprotei archaeon]